MTIPNYLPNTTPGTTRRRAKRVVIEYPEDGQISITWQEEDAIQLDGGERVFLDKGIFVSVIDDFLLSTQIPILNLDTGGVVGSVRGLDLFNQFSSLYIYCTQNRDSQQEFAETP